MFIVFASFFYTIKSEEEEKKRPVINYNEKNDLLHSKRKIRVVSEGKHLTYGIN